MRLAVIQAAWFIQGDPYYFATPPLYLAVTEGTAGRVREVEGEEARDGDEEGNNSGGDNCAK